MYVCLTMKLWQSIKKEKQVISMKTSKRLLHEKSLKKSQLEDIWKVEVKYVHQDILTMIQ